MSDTASAHDELVEKVARLYEDKWGIRDYGLARAALAVARPMIREECARMADSWYGEPSAHPTLDNAIQMVKHACGVEIAAAIRAMD
jgi:hypothetical protein